MKLSKHEFCQNNVRVGTIIPRGALKHIKSYSINGGGEWYGVKSGWSSNKIITAIHGDLVYVKNGDTNNSWKGTYKLEDVKKCFNS